MSAWSPSPEEKTASFLANLLQSQLGPWLIGAAFVTLGLGALTEEGAFFLATALCFVFAGVASHLEGKRKQEQAAIQMCVLRIPQPHGLPADTPMALIYAWAAENPHLVRRSMTRKEAKKVARERGEPLSSLEQFIRD